MAGAKKSPLLPVLILLMGLFAFEVFNFATTEAALSDIFGGVEILTLSIATWFAFGACFVDFGGLYRMFTAETKMKNESREVKIIFVAWIFAAILNAGLTFWVVSLALERGNVPMPSAFIGNELWVAVAIAFMVFVIRFGLISSLGHVGERFTLPALPKRNRFGGGKKATSGFPAGMNIQTSQPRPTGKK